MYHPVIGFIVNNIHIYELFYPPKATLQDLDGLILIKDLTEDDWFASQCCGKHSPNLLYSNGRLI